MSWETGYSYPPEHGPQMAVPITLRVDRDTCHGHRGHGHAGRDRIQAVAPIRHRGKAGAGGASLRSGIRRRRPFPPESGSGIEDRESAARAGEHAAAATGTTETGPRLAEGAAGERSPGPGSVRKTRRGRDAYRGLGPGLPHGSDRVPLMCGLTRDPEQVTQALPGDAFALLRPGDRVLQ